MLDPGIAKYAQANDVQFSSFACPDDLLNCLFEQLPEQEKLIFYICAVQQSEIGISIMDCDPRMLRSYPSAQRAALEIIKDEKAMKSFRGRKKEDFLNPRKGTIIYKAITWTMERSYLKDAPMQYQATNIRNTKPLESDTKEKIPVQYEEMNLT